MIFLFVLGLVFGTSKDEAFAVQLAQQGHLELAAINRATLKAYLQALTDFVEFAKFAPRPRERTGRARMDKLLSLYFNSLFISSKPSLQTANNAFSGVLAFRPELKGHLSLSHRTLKAFEKRRPPRERGPWSDRGVGSIAQQMLDDGEFEASLITCWQFMTFGREQDWKRLRTNDLAFSLDASSSPYAVAIKLGVQERGESTKTGFNQGIDVAPPDNLLFVLVAMQLLVESRRQRRRRHDARVFELSPSQYRKIWGRAAKKLGLPPDPPHVLRHAGASHFYQLWQAQGLDALRRVQIQGRWKSLKSVKRYTKTFLIAHFDAKVSEAVLRSGATFWQQQARFLQRIRLWILGLAIKAVL